MAAGACHHASQPAGIRKIKHIIVIMQENRSFDSYFGTYPGAGGLPEGVCVPDPRHGGCIKPYADHQDSDINEPHAEITFNGDVNGGKMDGLVAEAEKKSLPGDPCPTDVMGHHVGSDIPNYWAYARNFVLQDHMHESTLSWSLPSHLFEVSAWSARCSGEPMTCAGTNRPFKRSASDPTPYAWTELTLDRWMDHHDETTTARPKVIARATRRRRTPTSAPRPNTSSGKTM